MRRGQKRSKPCHNLEQRTEAELKQQRLMERAPCRKYKKRLLKDLSAQEIEAIVAAAKQPDRLH